MNREELSECGTLRGWGRSTSAGSRRLVCSVRPEPGPVWARTSAAYVCLPLCASFVHPRHPRSRSTLSPFPAFSFVHVATINTSVRRLRPSAARPVWICTGCACLYLLGMSSLTSVFLGHIPLSACSLKELHSPAHSRCCHNLTKDSRHQRPSAPVMPAYLRTLLYAVFLVSSLSTVARTHLPYQQ